jgi:hypothetical protein
MGIVDGWPLEIADESPRALRTAVQMLLDIEAIRRVKHAYFRCIDTGNFAELEGLFHPDVTVHFIGGTYEWKLRGRAEYLAAIQQSFHSRSVGHHNGHHPEIQILSADEATGIWYLADNMWVLDRKNFATGTAIYWDRYRKVDGKWLIADTKYERIYEMNQHLSEDPKFHASYLAKYGQELHE